MWDNLKRQRFQELRQPGRPLDAAEQLELASLVRELEAAEAAYLKPATERLRQENDRAEQQNRDLEKVLKRKEALAERLNNVLAEARIERRAIENELASVLAASQEADAED